MFFYHGQPLLTSIACSETFTFAQESTDSATMGYSVGTEISAGADFGFVSAALKVSADFQQGWDHSDTKRTTVARTYDMNRGEICAPTSIQMNIQCNAEIIRSDPGPDGHIVVEVYDKSGSFMTNLLNCYDGFNGVSGDAMDKLCAAWKSNPAPVTMDLGGGCMSDREPWSIQGCMYH